jgi:hypothetical protein
MAARECDSIFVEVTAQRLCEDFKIGYPQMGREVRDMSGVGTQPGSAFSNARCLQINAAVLPVFGFESPWAHPQAEPPAPVHPRKTTAPAGPVRES